MIIKSADDKQPQLEILDRLLNHPDADATTKKRIIQEIRNIQAGIRGESEASYEMKVHYGESKNWMIINDLRIEHGDLVAQIDHLLINRFLEVWVCESKNFSEGIAINEYGEFSAFFGGRPYGVPSPIEQNHNHIVILKRLFDSGAVNLPKRLGFTLKPDLKSIVLVSKKARISRPKAKTKGLECIIKNDQFSEKMDKEMNESNNPLMIAKMVSQETIERLGKEIAALHKPITFSWAAKFGLSAPAIADDSRFMPPPTKQAAPEVTASKPTTKTEPVVDKKEKKPKKKLICHTCGVAVEYNVAKFCWFNKKKFGENIYCRECQTKV